MRKCCLSLLFTLLLTTITRAETLRLRFDHFNNYRAYVFREDTQIGKHTIPIYRVALGNYTTWDAMQPTGYRWNGQHIKLFSNDLHKPLYAPAAKYEITPITGPRTTLFQELFGRYYDEALSKKTTANALSLAIWELRNEAGSTLDLYKGDFSLTEWSYKDGASLANTMLDSLDGTGPKREVLELDPQLRCNVGKYFQSLLTAGNTIPPAPVPVPEPTFFIACIGIAITVWFGRKRLGLTEVDPILSRAAFLVLLACTGVFAEETIPPIPGLSDWEAIMKDNAQIIKRQPATADCGNIQEGDIWYYDGISIFHQIAQYTKDKTWLKVAAKCRSYYRDGYAIRCKQYSVDGWRNFTRGLYYDWTVLKDETSKKTAIEIAKRSKFSQIVHASDIRKWDKNVDVSREVAYCITAWHVAKDLGAPEFSGRDPYLDTALSHLAIWKTYLTGYPHGTYPGDQSAKYQPFMFALTAEALIRVYERPETSDADKAKILESIYPVAKLTYDKLYSDTHHGFMSNTGNPQTYWGSIDLLTVPVYGWLWHVTGERYFLDAGDKVWKNWGKFGWPEIRGWGGKQFSQNFRWSFDYVRWRSVAPEPNPRALELKMAK